ncbi:energy transducer TonB [Sphingomonas sp. GCM10030256]|uniref:energy transducer TonB n=1 Tax=Sphingomonas sp. GCM10030256 TaxID=3273427 RepID=UPI0036093446
MQRTLLSPRDRAGSIAAVLAVHAGILLALLNAQGRTAPLRDEAPPIETFDVLPPEPPPPPVVEEKPRPRQDREEGAAAPPNKISQATPVEAPKPIVVLPAIPPITTSPTPREGTDATQGAAVPGPGTGAGGSGTGTGSGGSGSGTGGGGGGQVPTRPTVVESTKLTSRDYPREVIRAWPRRGAVFTAVRVQLDGRATDCKVNRSSGNPVVDQWTCRLIEERVRFRPATDDRGQPYVSWYGYIQSAVNF